MPPTNIPRPDPNTYWVVPDQFLAGEYPFSYNATDAHAKLARYLDAGIDSFIDLTESHELEPYLPHLPAGVEYQRMSVRDLSVPSVCHMTGILDHIDTSLAAGRRVYVHCWGGVGRTGTTVGCWLQRHGRTGEEALQEIARHWSTVAKSHRVPRSPETREQAEWVLSWQRLSSAAPSIRKEDR